MSNLQKLTDKENHKSSKINYFQKNIDIKNDNLKLELENNYYENLFLEEMEFKFNPKKEKIPSIIRKYCKGVEFLSSKDDNKRANQYKSLIDIFLNSPNVINLLENKDYKRNIDDNSFMKRLLISNKNKHLNGTIIDDDNVTIEYQQLKNILKDEEKNKYNNIMDKNEKINKRKDSINLINEEIKDQQNNFRKKLKIKRNSLFKKEKNIKLISPRINGNKIIESIQNAFINENKENNSLNLITIDKTISPIKIESNSSNKENISNNIINSFSLSNENNTNKNEENISLLNLSINKKNISEFEPSTPTIISKFQQSEENIKNMDTTHSEEINETNDFSLNNDNFINLDKSKSKKPQTIIQCKNENSNKIKVSSNLDNIFNSSLDLNNLKNSESNNNIFKSFRLDFYDLFEYIQQSHTISKKEIYFCNEIKSIIENYLNKFNNHLNEVIFIKILNKFTNVWNEIFNRYKKISEIYDNEIKKIDEKLTEGISDEEKLKELSNLSENLKNEKEYEINKFEERFNEELESITVELKNNCINKDKGIALLNEKFTFLITKKLFDMINNKI